MRALRFFVLAGFVVGLGLSSLESCGPAKCTCPNGCCDSKGACQTGTSTTACGKSGATCVACASTQTCNAQVCSSGTGGGSGGSAGGGTGGTGGGSAGGGAGGGSGNCTNYAIGAPVNIIGVGYDDSDPQLNFNWTTQVLAADNTAHTFDYLSTELYWTGTSPMIPYAAGTVTAQTYNQCDVCFVLWRGVDQATGSGGTRYLAQAGSYAIPYATRNHADGRYAASGTNLHFVQWQYSNSPAIDQAVVDGGCADLTAFSFDATWHQLPNDGGWDIDAGH